MVFYLILFRYFPPVETPPVVPAVYEEPEKIKKWREEQKTRLEQKGNHWFFSIVQSLFESW